MQKSCSAIPLCQSIPFLCRILSIFIIAILFGCRAEKPKTGVNYYIDAVNGCDTNCGTSPMNAWKSLAKIKQVRLKPGDSLLLCRGSIFNEQLELSAQGTSSRRIIIDAYGEGGKPYIMAPDSSLYTICIHNSDYVTLQNIEISNKGSKRMAYRTGVKILCENYGTSHNIVLNALDIHDVNGSLIKHEGGGCGIFIQNNWKNDSLVSVFDSLVIENCTIRRCERNAIIWSAPWSRKDWNLSTNTLVRKNLIEEVPGDGIVPIGCDSAIIEYNLMRNCPATLPDGQAAAGIWPWSCDNTIIRFNEVSGHQAPWNGQGFDSDFNCTNTTIEYNYSHDNDGGFILICDAGSETDPADNIGNLGSKVCYNVSINDAIRRRKTHVGVFSPTIHIAGPVRNTLIERNILHTGKKLWKYGDHTLITSNHWGGYADSTLFRENIFYASEPSAFQLTQSTNNKFENNYYFGIFAEKPNESHCHENSAYYNSLIGKHANAKESLDFLFEKVTIGNGAATMMAVRPENIHELFENLKKQKKP